jgi:hypothetical protein
VRLVGALLALVLVAGGFLLGRRLESDAAEQNARAAQGRAEKFASDAVTGLEKQLALFQLKAQGAASSPALQAMVHDGVDEATFHDTLSTEEWAASFRDRAASVTVFAARGRLGSTASMLDDTALAAVALAAEDSGESSTFIPHQGLYLVAGAKLPFSTRDGKKVAVVLARPLGQDELDALGAGPLLISDGKAKLGSHGDAALLAELPGRESSGRVAVGGSVACARPLGGLWVWSLSAIGDEVAPLVPVSVVWVVSLALAMAVLAFTLLAGRNKPIALDQVATAPDLEGRPAVMGTRPPTPSQLGPAALASTSPSMNTISRYVEVAPLGEGGMARVSLAVTHGAEGFRRHFVVKRLKTELTVNPEIVAQFIDEARLGASLVHSNVVPVFDFGRDSDGYFIAQEYIMGRDLDAVRRALFELHRATLDLPLVLYVAQEALKALSYAHGKTDDSGRSLGLVHRDVSPNNLMISARGEVKLLDFGIVKAEGKLSQTQTGMIKGNVFYMSPEQARALPVDGRSDLFSLGLVLFTAAAGETLYRGSSNYELLTRAAEGLSASEWERVARLPPTLRTLLERVLQFDLGKRYGSAEEFADAIPVAQVGSAAAMQQLMEALFKDDFTRERARFSTTAITEVAR